MEPRCSFYSCTRDAHPDPENKKGRCGDCWREDDEHAEYQRKWYASWNKRGRSYTVNIKSRNYHV